MSKLLAAVLFAASMSACVDDPDVETSAAAFGGSGGGGLGNGTSELQGRQTLGKGLDGGTLDYLSTLRTGTRANSPQADFAVVAFGPFGNGSCLQSNLGGIPLHQCADPAFNGYSFVATSGATVQIVSSTTVQTSTTPDPVRVATGYELRLGGQPYCPNNHLAFPINGALTRGGGATPLASSLTWACSEFLPNGAYDPNTVVGNGVRAKAIAWGFPAEGPALTTPLGSITGADLQTTAVRVGHADYCYSGAANTIEGTSIGYADLVGGNLVPTQPSTDLIETSPTEVRHPIVDGTFYVEAAWRKPNLTTLGEEIGRPLCLSKLRWSVLKVADLCLGSGVKLLDPRIQHPGGVDGVYCEDYINYAGLGNAGAVIVNTSQFNDVGLRLWTNATTNDNYTTTIGAYKVARPANNYDYQDLLGTILTGTGRDVWAAAYPTDAATFNPEPLKSCSNAGHHITAPASQIPAGFTTGCAVEGYYFTARPTAGLGNLGLTATRLYLHANAAGTDFLTDTSATAGPPYTTNLQLGWILAPRTY